MLYRVQNPMDKAFQGLGGEQQAAGSMMRANPKPEKTAGGALLNAGSGALTGLSAASTMAEMGMVGAGAGPWGLAIGAGVGLLSYMFS